MNNQICGESKTGYCIVEGSYRELMVSGRHCKGYLCYNRTVTVTTLPQLLTFTQSSSLLLRIQLLSLKTHFVLALIKKAHLSQYQQTHITILRLAKT